MTDTLVPQVASPRAVLTGTAPDHSEGMSYLESLPRRLVTLYLPLGVIMLVSGGIAVILAVLRYHDARTAAAGNLWLPSPPQGGYGQTGW